MLQETIVRERKGEVPQHSISGHLLRVPDSKDSTKPLSNADLAAQIAVFFIAGVDTTGHTIAWTLYNLTQNPEVMRKLEQELDEAGLLVTASRPSPRPLQYTDLSQLTYLNWVLKESMRMSPVIGGGVPRVALRDVTLNGHFFPKGTVILSMIHATHHHPDNWDRPDDFIPERWNGEGVEYLPEPSSTNPSKTFTSQSDNGSPAAMPDGEDKAPSALPKNDLKNRPLRYLPFGAGPRQCIGMALAKMNALTTLALLVSNFSFQLADRMGGPEGVLETTVERISVIPQGGMWLHCAPRSRATTVA
eukprot:jgi/Botrbrau1/17995/Bobra.0713s0002.1